VAYLLRLLEVPYERHELLDAQRTAAVVVVKAEVVQGGGAVGRLLPRGGAGAGAVRRDERCTWLGSVVKVRVSGQGRVRFRVRVRAVPAPPSWVSLGETPLGGGLPLCCPSSLLPLRWLHAGPHAGPAWRAPVAAECAPSAGPYGCAGAAGPLLLPRAAAPCGPAASAGDQPVGGAAQGIAP
jgi:hypothetical protein